MKSIKESVDKILEYFDNNDISIDVFQEDEMKILYSIFQEKLNIMKFPMKNL